MIRAAIVLTSAAAVAASIRLRRRKGASGFCAGAFANGMGYVRLGTGVKTLLWIPDPDHSGDLAQGSRVAATPPRSGYMRFMTKVLGPFVEDGYSVYLVGHKPGLPVGCTVADLAEDYAALIAEEFGGKVELVVADSRGGMIGFVLAAAHPDLFGHIAFAAAAHTWTEGAKAAELTSARLLSAGRRTDAAMAMVTFLKPGFPVWVRRLWASVVARVSFPAENNPSDVLLAAKALDAFDGREILPTITVPVLLVCGDRDTFAPMAIYEQTAELISGATLSCYEGKGHLGALMDRRLSEDILGFVRR